MNKIDLVRDVASKLQGMSLDVTQKNTNLFIEAFLETIEESLLKGEEVRLLGFGTFSLITRKAHKGIVPKTGEKINVPEKRVVKFKPGKLLKEKVLKTSEKDKTKKPAKTKAAEAKTKPAKASKK